ncbi:23974_t:CDS:10 [Gigaspora margarita]|uniref:23974_t:CDS:1 n=1 Tax=Gigaspora margarita TaxID=4874 RepID=A0ABN7USC8_GIGMA|nr:23974_t:CDS:10 [Gigaspora margarita]
MKEYHDLLVHTVYERHPISVAGCYPLRMNLTAVSNKFKDIFFVAIYDSIFAYRLNSYHDEDDTPKKPFKKLNRPIDSTSHDDEEQHIINAIKVGEIGYEEVLVSVDESGDIHVWYTSNLEKDPLHFKNDESTWGIALNGPRRLLAVSANSHEITIFNLQYGLQKLAKFSDSQDMSFKPKYSLRGHRHNIPNISFSSCGQFLVSCSIDKSCRIWNVNTGQTIVSQEVSSEWGWSACFVSASNFKNANNTSRNFRTCKDVHDQSRSRVGRVYTGSESERDNEPNSDISTALRPAIRFLPLDTEYEDGYDESSEIRSLVYNDYGTIETIETEDEENDSNYSDTQITNNNNENTSSDDSDHDHSSHTPIPDDMSDDEWSPSAETRDIYNNNFNVQNVDEISLSERTENGNISTYSPRYPSPIVYVSHFPSTPIAQQILPEIYFSSNSPAYSPATPQYMLEPSSSTASGLGPNSLHTPPTAYSPPQPTSLVNNIPTSQEHITTAFSSSSFNSEYIRSESPVYSPMSPEYSPINTNYAPESPHYDPMSPQYTPTSPSYNPTYARPRAQDFFEDVPDNSYGNELQPQFYSHLEEQRDNHLPQFLNRKTKIGMDRLEMHKMQKGRAPKISQDLVLFGTQHDLFLLDPKSGLSIISSSLGVVCRNDPRRARHLDSNDRLNMIEWIPDLSLAIVASQKGKVALVRLLKGISVRGIEHYDLYDEKLIPQIPLPNAPLIDKVEEIEEIEEVEKVREVEEVIEIEEKEEVCVIEEVREVEELFKTSSAYSVLKILLKWYDSL